MADTNQSLHDGVTRAWNKHDEWLESGGENAQRRVQEANLMVNVSMELYAAEGVGFKRGWNDGYKAGYEKAVADEKRKQNEVKVPEAPEQPT
jgi:hypothetical protein